MVEPPRPLLAQGQGPPRRRSGRDGRSPRRCAAGAGRGRAGRGRLRASCRPWSPSTRRSRPARRCCSTTRAAATSASTGTSATRRPPTPPSRKAAARRRRSSSSTTGSVPNAMEPRAAIGDYDAATGDYTLYTTSQNPHVIRLLIGAFSLQVPEHKLRVVAPDVGGGFGIEDLPLRRGGAGHLGGRAARPPGQVDRRPQRGLPLRRPRPRPRQPRPSSALDADGKFLGLRVARSANMGAYLSTFAPVDPDLPLRHAAGRPVRHAGDLRRGQGRLHQHRAGRRLSRRRPAGGDLRARAAGRQAPRASWASTRSRSAGATSSRPSSSPTRRRSRSQYDIGDYQRRSTWRSRRCRPRRLRRSARRRAREARQAARHRHLHLHRGLRHRAVGIVGALGARAGLYESGEVRVNPTGAVTRLHRHPQPRPGPRDHLRPARLRAARRRRSTTIEIVHGDTDRIPFGMGTYGSRSLAVGGSALRQGARQDHRQGQEDRRAPARGAPTRTSSSRTATSASPAPTASKTFGEIAFAAYVPHNYPIETLEPGLDETAFYDPTNFTSPAAATSSRSRSIPRPASSRSSRFTGRRRLRRASSTR